MNKTRFQNQIVLITGASSGIGKATALAFAKEGATTVLASRSREGLQRVADEIRQLNGRPFVVPVDVSSQEQVRQMVAAVVEKYGRIDILFNNAGASMVGRIDEDDFIDKTRKMLEVGFMGTIYVTREVLPVMKRQGSGRILNMSSVVGRKAFPHFGGYSSAMHALAGFTDALRQELKGTGVNVSVIHPALTQTALLSQVRAEDMPPPFRYLTPISAEKVANAALDGIHKNKPRIIVPFQPNLLLFADAISPKLGDQVVRLLQNRIFGRLIGTYKGTVYRHDVAI